MEDMAAGLIIVYSERPERWLGTHEAAVLEHVARVVGRLTGREWGGHCLSRPPHPFASFVIAQDTLLTTRARTIGVRCAADLLGGIVPAAVTRTKAIVHPLVGPDSARPDGWPERFAASVEDLALPGFTAFTEDDAVDAVRRLLRLGAVRVKRPVETGGRGQHVIHALDGLSPVLATVDDGELRASGLVLEMNLTDVTTLSVGQTTIDDVVLSYHGVQRETTDNQGQLVYGGSDLVCVRGGWTALTAAITSPLVRTAVELARAYDTAADAHTGVVASRRNYDIGHGRDAAGRPRTGVFEHSWRVGGATAAEIGAFEAFRDDPTLDLVHASTIERFGRDLRAPRGALVVYEGEDVDVGPIGCYTTVARATSEAT